MKRISFSILVFLIGITIFASPILAITANSSSYTVGSFGTGMVTSNSSSTNYESLSLTELAGTTRNAESDSYTSNIGFFDDTPYHRTVSITSYSVYPASSEVISTIRLYISALNYESVWANITRPDGVVEKVALSNNDYKYYTAGIVGRYDVIFYANSSIGAISSVVDYFDVTEVATSPAQQPSGGSSSTTTIIEQCTYNWDCTPWSVCSGGKQTRECKNIGTCNGTENKPIEEMKCSEALFDIVLRLDNIKLNENNSLKFKVNLEEKMGVEKIDVYVKYSIVDDNDYKIFSQIETKAIQGNLTFEKEISEIKLDDGKYILRVDILYGNLQRAFTEQSFNVVKGEIVIGKMEKWNYKIILLLLTILVVSILILWFIILAIKRARKGKRGLTRQKHYKEKKFHRRKKLRKKHLAILTGFIGIVVLLYFLLKFEITAGLTGNVIDTISKAGGKMLIIVFSLMIIFAIFLIARKMKLYIKIKEFIEKIRGGFKKKHSENMIGDLLNKKVYSSEGQFIGRVDEIILGSNRIESLRITLDKSHGFSEKGIIVSYKHLECISDVIMINQEILSFLLD